MVDKNGSAVNDAYVFKTSCVTLKRCLKMKFVNIPEKAAVVPKVSVPYIFKVFSFLRHSIFFSMISMTTGLLSFASPREGLD